MECSSAGWTKPIGEQYPAEGFLDRLVARGLTFTTASDAHSLERVGGAPASSPTYWRPVVCTRSRPTPRQRQMIPLRAS